MASEYVNPEDNFTYMDGFRKAENSDVSNAGFGDKNNYAWWVGDDGYIWANVGGVGVRRVGKYDASKDKNGYTITNGINSSPIGLLSNDRRIEDPAKSNVSSYDAYTAQLNAEKARRQGEAQNIKSSMLGKRDQVENILKDILANIKSVYDEEKTKRDEQYEGDSSALIDQLNQALPDIGSSFAAIGAYDSSWNNDAQGRTKEEHNKAQEEIKKEYDADMVTLGDKKNQAETDARNARDNFMIDFDTFNDTEANSDNLENLRASKNSLLKAMNDFNAQGDYFKPGSTLQKEMSGLGSYDGQKVRDSFSSFLNTAGAGGSGVEAVEASGNSLKANKNKKEKSEIEQNKATGVSK